MTDNKKYRLVLVLATGDEIEMSLYSSIEEAKDFANERMERNVRGFYITDNNGGSICYRKTRLERKQEEPINDFY